MRFISAAQVSVTKKCPTQKAIDEKFGCAIESDAEVNRKRANCDPSLKTNAEDQDTTCSNKFQPLNYPAGVNTHK